MKSPVRTVLSVALEDEGVVDERTAEDVTPDEHTLVTEAGLADQRVGRARTDLMALKPVKVCYGASLLQSV